MAKSSKKTSPRPAVPRPAPQLRDTGIYTASVETIPHGEMTRARLQEILDHNRQLRDPAFILAAVKEDLAEIRRRDLAATAHACPSLSFPGITPAPWCREWGDRTETSGDARLARHELQLLQRARRRGDIIAAAYWMGRHHERLLIRPKEPAAMTGTKTRATLDAGRAALQAKAVCRRDRLAKETHQAIAEAKEELRAAGKPPEYMRKIVARKAANILRIQLRSFYKRVEAYAIIW